MFNSNTEVICSLFNGRTFCYGKETIERMLEGYVDYNCPTGKKPNEWIESLNVTEVSEIIKDLFISLDY